MSQADKPMLRPYKKHVLVCTGSRCAPDESPSVYQYLKNRLKELGLHDGPRRIQRSQAKCFGICKGGPLAVVYPEGTWYQGVSQEAMERIIQEHLIGENPVSASLISS